MKTKDFKWEIKGKNEKNESISMDVEAENIQYLINHLYDQTPNLTKPCEFCKYFDECVIKPYEKDCNKYKEKD